MFSKTVLNDIRDRISIVGYIGERIPLKRAGRTFKGRCPFHNEKTPSFNVSDEKGIYHCFGCGEGGDIFQFVMKFEGQNFADAVRTLAGRAGVELPRDVTPAQRAAEDDAAQKKRSYLRLNEIARDHFAAVLRDPSKGSKARQYLQHRGIPDEFWTQHFLGYADNSWDSLAAALSAAKAPLDLAAELGLVKRRDGGGYYDFFRDRLIFPIVSPRGEVLGFGGRTLEKSGDAAKYINSPDSAIYHKSNCVYGLDRAAQAIRKLDQVILVEGYMDLIALHQSGIENVAAPLGTALTQGHLRILARYTRNFVVVFDGDEAGSRAASRALELFIEEGLSPRVVPIPAGHDPDTLVREEGADAFRRRVENAPPLFEHFVDKAIAQSGGDSSGKVAALSRVLPLLAKVSDAAERGIYRRYVAQRLDVDESAIEQSLASKNKATAGTDASIARPARAAAPVAQVRGESAVLAAERILIEMMLTRPETIGDLFGAVGPDDFEDEWCRTVASLLHDAWKSEGKVKMGPFIDGLEDGELAGQLRAVAMGPGRCGDDEVSDLVKDCVARIQGRPAAAKMKFLNEEIRRAQSQGDDSRLLELMGEKRELAQQAKVAAQR